MTREGIVASVIWGGGEDREEEGQSGVDDGVSAWASRMTTSDVGTSTISIISLADF
jgi:hypothetical protein